MFAGVLLLWPKLTGCACSTSGWGKIHFLMLFIVLHHLPVQHFLGVQGMPRRYADYMPEDGFTLGNQVSTAGSVLLGLSMILFAYNVWKTWRTALLIEVDDPWGYGASPEWATSCPPPRHNPDQLPDPPGTACSTCTTWKRHRQEPTTVRPATAVSSRRSARRTSAGTSAATSRRGLTRAGNGAHRHPHRGLRLRHGGDLRRSGLVWTEVGFEWVGVIGLILGGLLGLKDGTSG